MTRNELIAAVVLDFIKSHLDQEPNGSIRFCMLGLEASLVRSVAEAILSDSDISSDVIVRIPSLFDSESSLPAEIRSSESITHWRHCPLPENRRAVLFAAPQEELQRNDKSVEKITKIETDTLRARYNAWADQVGLTSKDLDESKHQHLLIALESANKTHAARTIEAFADFVLSIAEGIITKGFPLQKSIDYALPSLKLPRYSGNFDRIPEKKRNSIKEWNKIFKELHTKIRPLLVQETEKGERISKKQLSTNFKKISKGLDEHQRQVIDTFLKADLSIDDWADAQKELADLDWKLISGLFEGVAKKASTSLGKETSNFFKDEFDDLFKEDEETKELLASKFPKDPSNDLQDFFEAHQEHLARDKKLSGKWERYIYPNTQIYDDFLVGLLDTLDILRRRISDDDLTEKKLVVRIPRAREKSFWRGKNSQVVRYFAFRYRGLQAILGDRVELDFGKLMEFYFPQVDKDLAKIKLGSKDARSIKFEAILDPEGAEAKLLFQWEMPVHALATTMPCDLLTVANEEEQFVLLPTADITRQSISAKGSIQRITLDDINTIRDITKTNDGKLVEPNEENSDRAKAFLSHLTKLEHDRILGPDAKKIICDRFQAFRIAYSEAIRDWVAPEGPGISSEALFQQVIAYDELLVTLLEHANNGQARQKLWYEILRFGVANIGAGSPAAIITPWHPLRLAEIHIKAVQATKLIRDVLNAEERDIVRADLLFSQVKLELVENYYPEVCIGFDHKRSLLSAIDNSYDYTLAEPPLKSKDGNDALDIDPGVAAKAFSNIGEQYLKLLPHERSNFSVVLYNAESKGLPSALAAELSSKVEKENELQCDLLLTHSESQRMRRMYEQQNATVHEESGSVMASEAARNFLSRLRIGFVDATKISEDENDRVADLVALQNVVGRNAQLVWKKNPFDEHPDLNAHVPARWSRRRPIDLGDTAISVYLTCPMQPKPSQSYLNFIHRFREGDNAALENVIPAREVDFRDSDISHVFTQTHKIGEWVVNFDELVDRRLLSNNGVRVIRHIRDRQVDRNIVVSTTSKPKLLRALLHKRLSQLDETVNSDTTIDQLIDQANILSGQVVMRAARYGHYANELLGVVLSMEEIRKRLGDSNLPIGWYFLDDFVSWFGQREEQIADIMAIAPRMVDGQPVLKVAISEAKFVSSHGYRAQAKKSAKQLEETVIRLGRAIDPNQKRIDRDIWLNLIGEFMIEGMEPFDLNDCNLHQWSYKVKKDEIPIQLAGFSHVFIHDEKEYVDSSDAISLKGMAHCTQQIFDKAGVISALHAFANKGNRSEEQVEMKDDTWSDVDLLISTRTGSKIYVETTNTEMNTASDTQTHTPRSESVESRNEQEAPQTEVHIDAPSSTGSNMSSQSNSEPEDLKSETPEKLLEMWPSQQLAEWVNKGAASEEDDEDTKAWLDHTVKALQKALRGYDMTAELIGARLTPNSALIRLRGSNDLTVPKVDKKRQELLTSHAIDVVNVLAAPLEIIIMVKRPHRAILRLQDLWRRRQLPSTAPESNTSLLLGAKESDGEILYLNVGNEFGGNQAHGPHTLIAGETGSGKGVLVQSLLLDICATNSPKRARIRMIDPKAGIDFPWLRHMPHLEGELIIEQDEAIRALEDLVAEMERRNRLLAEAGVTKLDNYNCKVPPSEQLPRIWLFHDELADWMMIDEYRDAVDLNASRLGVKARAAGINLVLITQRPDKDALPMQLRANLTNRLVLKVADKKNSILVLDEPGAERLLGRGHLAAKLSGEGKVILAQVPFASEDEIVELAHIIQNSWEIE